MKRSLILIVYLICVFSTCPKVLGQTNSAILTATTATGSITTCQGTASASPSIEEFTVYGNYLSSGPVVTAPSGFEVSLSLTSGYGNSVVLPAVATSTGGQVHNQLVYVRASAAAPVGNTSATITVTATGATSLTIGVNEVVNPAATVNTIPDQTIVNGGTTAAVNFTGTGGTFVWTNDTPGIGLAASGSGNISSFTGVNNTSSPITATITVTPEPAGFAYIPNAVDNDVSVINTATNQVVATVPVGTYPWSVAITPNGNYVYIVNQNSYNVSVINTATNKVIATIPVGTVPNGVIASPDGSYIYVTNILSNSISVISTASNTVINTITGVTDPYSLAISKDGSELYVVNGTSTISIINTSTLVISNISTPSTEGASFIVLSPDNQTAYVTSENTNVVLAMDVITGAVKQTYPISLQPFELTISPDGSKLYVASQIFTYYLSVINTATNSITKIPISTDAEEGLSLSPDGSKLFITNLNASTVSAINTATNAVVATIPVGKGPYGFGSFVSPTIGCSGIPNTFTITVNPTTSAAITSSGTINSMNTVYGTPSAPASFSISGNNLGSGVLVSPPAGFEVSADGVTYSNTVMVGGAGNVPSTIIYIRLAGTAAVNTYTGNVVLTATNAVNENVSIANSIISPAMLNITADTIHKKYGNILAGNSGSTAFTSTGLQNNESIGSVTMAYGNGSAAIAPVGIYTGSVIPSLPSGGSFNPNNYTISYTPDNIIIDPVDLTITADNKTKVFGADNPLLTVTYSGFVNNENAVVLNPGPTINTTAVATSPVGSYPITAYGANAQNYTITYVAGVLTINPVHIQLIIPNAFTPNGDGINDTWQIQHIESFPNCTVFVYNRYGEVVLSSTGYGIPWDGTYKGSALPSGTYYYLIDTKTNTKMISGWVAIIR